MAPIDLSDPRTFEEQTCYSLFDQARVQAPVSFCDSERGAHWSIVRYDDIVAVERDTETFSSSYELGGIRLQDQAIGSVIETTPSFISTDPPRHRERRELVRPAFSLRNMAALEAEIRERVIALLTALPRNEVFDWVAEVSCQLPIQMLSTLFGVPQEDRALLLQWSNVMTGFDDPDVVPDMDEARAQLKDFAAYVYAMREDRLEKPPQGDLVSMLVHGPAARSHKPIDYLSDMVLLTIGGNDTTRNSISSGLYELSRHPEQWEQLRVDRSLLRTGVSEMLRWATPVIHVRRTATRDTVFRGQHIAKGDRVVVWYLSANRDEDVFTDPYAFRIDRRERRHLSFGTGVHFCVGAPLAEMQLRVLWEEILDRFPRIDIESEPVRLRSNFIHGIKSLRVRIPAD
ncbi:MAG: cytochrome P450 [Pseudomonadota bacterium]